MPTTVSRDHLVLDPQQCLDEVMYTQYIPDCIACRAGPIRGRALISTGGASPAREKRLEVMRIAGAIARRDSSRRDRGREGRRGAESRSPRHGERFFARRVGRRSGPISRAIEQEQDTGVDAGSPNHQRIAAEYVGTNLQLVARLRHQRWRG